MKHVLTFTFQVLFFCIFTSVSGQSTLSGNITNSSGEPIPYATIYIQELQHGTTANATGKYEIKLAPGTYTVFFQSLGYNQDFRQITVTTSPVVRDVALTIQYFQIPEVNVSATGEDPAYAVMRKAIARAPYYLNAVEHYKADVYLKGTVDVTRIPRLLEKAISSNEVKIKEGDKYVMESHNEIEFNAPDKYIHHVIAIQSNFPVEEGSSVSPMDYIQASFYEPVIADIAISPLAPNAFSYYKFVYQGATLQGNFVINKIKVIPKRKSQQVFSGTIYIIEDLWCIHSLDLVNENLAGKIGVKQVHTPVQDGLWLPVSHKFDIDFAMIGIKAIVGYGSSVKYSEIRPNKSFAAMPVLPATAKPAEEIVTVEPPKSKGAVEMEKLLAKEELTTRDMVKLSKMIEKEAATAGQTKDPKKDLEIIDNTKFIIEDDAARKSSEYWREIRPIPLSIDEQKAMKIADTLKSELVKVDPDKPNDVTIGVSSGKKNSFNRFINYAATGRTWRSDSGLVSLNFGGFVQPENFSFNSVDGFKYAVDFNFTKRWKRGTSFIIAPEIGYTFARKDVFWNVNTTLNYTKTGSAYFYFRAGDNSHDFSNYESVNIFINSYASLLFKENYLRLYRSQYMNLGHKSEISNGIYLELSAGTELRSVLENNTEFAFFNKDKLYSPNIPDNILIDQPLYPAYYPNTHRNYRFKADLTIIPYQKYRMTGNRKRPAGSDYPTYQLSYEQGYNDYIGSDAIYGKATASVSNDKSTGPMAEFAWKVRAGAIFTGDSIAFQDFFQFNTQPSPVLLNNYSDAFYLPGYYNFATDRWFVEGHVKYTTPYLLIKLLPGISKTLMRENLYAGYLVTKQVRHYLELGYGLSEIFFIGEVGVFVGFEDFKYQSTGVRFILRFN